MYISVFIIFFFIVEPKCMVYFFLPYRLPSTCLWCGLLRTLPEYIYLTWKSFLIASGSFGLFVYVVYVLFVVLSLYCTL